MVIENPYSYDHYLRFHWCIQPSMIDKDRREMGDYYKKPTQYFFINFEPQNNFIFEPMNYKKGKSIVNESSKTERSMISKDYANRFIREFILEENEVNGCMQRKNID